MQRPALSTRSRRVLRLVSLRIVFAVPVVLGVITLIFLVGALSGNDPARSVLGVDASAQARAAFDRAHGLDDPLPVRYVRYLNHLAHGNLGVGLVTQQPIWHMLGGAIPVTVSLTLLASGLALLLGLVFGTIAGVSRDSPVDKAVLVISSVGHALPAFWVGLIFIEVFAVHWHVIPSGGYVPLATGFSEWLHHLIGPALVLALPFGAVIARVVRSSIVQELEKEYVRTAQGLGLSMPTIIVRNVLRNALAAPLTTFGIGVGVLFSGAVLIESLFQLPGLGMMTVTGIQEGDFGKVSAVGIFGGIAFVAVNTVIDVVCVFLDPREATS